VTVARTRSALYRWARQLVGDRYRPSGTRLGQVAEIERLGGDVGPGTTRSDAGEGARSWGYQHVHGRSGNTAQGAVCQPRRARSLLGGGQIGQIGAIMKRPKTSSRDFRQAAVLEASVGHSREHADEVRDLVSLGDFLAPEMHRSGGLDEAASAVREWVDDNVVMIEEAETIAEDQHRDYSAEILHRAKLLATVAH
jgi:hypothetical protein